MMVMRGVTDVVFGGDLFCGGLLRWVVKGHGLNCPFGRWSSFNSGAGEKRAGEKRRGEKRAGEGQALPLLWTVRWCVFIGLFDRKEG